MTDADQILILLSLGICIALSAFFSSAETALTSISRIKLRSLLERNVDGANRLKKILEKPHRLISAILIGNNFVNITASTLATAFTLTTFKKVSTEETTLILSITTGVMTFIILAFGEITPKSLALKNPTRWALWISGIMYYFTKLMVPFIVLFDGIFWVLSKIFRFSLSETRRVTEEEIRSVLNLAEEDGIMESSEKTMLDGVLSFTDKVVREVMTPRTDTVCIEISCTLEEAITLFKKSGHSRIPVYEKDIDNIQGILYAKDLLSIPDSPKEKLIQKYLRKAEFIPETKDLKELLHQMKNSKFHLAIVVDEYGGTAGIITFEDLIEEIVGDVIDEFDNEPGSVSKLENDTYLIDASLNIDDLPNEIQSILPKEDEDYDSIGGFVLSELGSFPQKGESITYKNLTFTVRDIKKRRILSLEIKINPVEITQE